jgi:hypothetical protein
MDVDVRMTPSLKVTLFKPIAHRSALTEAELLWVTIGIGQVVTKPIAK